MDGYNLSELQGYHHTCHLQVVAAYRTHKVRKCASMVRTMNLNKSHTKELFSFKHILCLSAHIAFSNITTDLDIIFLCLIRKNNVRQAISGIWIDG